MGNHTGFSVKQKCTYCAKPSFERCNICKSKLRYVSIFRLNKNDLFYIFRTENKSNFIPPTNKNIIDKYKKSLFTKITKYSVTKLKIKKINLK
jgi:hypothetical protein